MNKTWQERALDEYYYKSLQIRHLKPKKYNDSKNFNRIGVKTSINDLTTFKV